MTSRNPEDLERSLESSEERLRHLLDTIPDIVSFKDPEGRWLEANRACLEIFQLTEVDFRGKTDIELAELSPFYRDAFLVCRQTDEIAWNLGAPSRGDEVIPFPDGRSRVFDVIKVPSFAAKGERKGLLVVARDITEQRWAEQERFRIEEKMFQTQKMESLGILAGGVAHDFNNLLMGVLGNADLALSVMAGNAPGRERVEDIVTAARRATDLSNQMLAYSGRGRFVVEKVDINTLVEEMAHLMEVVISKGVVLKLELGADIPPVEVDVTQLRQVIMNLISNASEAISGPSGLIRISTGLHHLDRGGLAQTISLDELPEGNYVFLEVVDTGCGMSSGTMDRIFDPFFTTKFTGRGLGLAAVHGIVRGHKGAIKVDSEPRKGTRFTILLPAAEIGLTEGDQGGTSEERKAVRVLVVDDESSVREVSRAYLERSGFEVLLAEDGLQGVEVFRARAHEIHCIILDFTMPVMSGEEALQEFAEIRPEVPVILSSGYDEDDVFRRLTGRAAAGFIQKPYNAKALIAKLAEFGVNPPG
ncbi:MAG: response regulator [Thermoanaerobaculales bacterium]|nr:response regulator [Thermoanaerobaculales bacterium]